MGILQEVYHITEPTSAIYKAKLIDPVTKFFIFDVDVLSEIDNEKADIFWNFGDPLSTDNEIISPTIVDSIMSHTYEYAGDYTVTSIVNVDGVLFHITRSFEIINDNPPTVTISPISGAYITNQLINITSDKEGTIYYTTDGSNPNSNSTQYINSFPLTAVDEFTITNYTVKAVIVDIFGEVSAIKTENYSIVPVLDVNASLPSGNY